MKKALQTKNNSQSQFFTILLACFLFSGCDGSENPPHPPQEKVDRSILVTTLTNGLPVDNRAFDPNFLLDSGIPQWFIEKNSDDFQICESYRRVTLTKFPVGRQGLMINGQDENPSGCIAWGTFLLGNEAVNVSIWLGSNSIGESIDARATYFDPIQGHSDVFQTMTRDDTSQMKIGDLFWYRYETRIPASAQGWGGVMVTHQSVSNLYLNGLIALDESSPKLNNKSLKVAVEGATIKFSAPSPITLSMKNSMKHRQEALQE